jgi:hypothetical protein
VQLLGAAEALREASGSPSAADADYEATLGRARQALGAAAFAEAWAEGRALAPHDVVELAGFDSP